MKKLIKFFHKNLHKNEDRIDNIYVGVNNAKIQSLNNTVFLNIKIFFATLVRKVRQSAGYLTSRASMVELVDTLVSGTSVFLT